MQPPTDPVKAAILNQIAHHEGELKKLRRALLAVTSNGRPRVVSSEFADDGIVSGAMKLLSNDIELTTRQIADRLLAGGYQTRSKDFVPTVHSTLRNSKKFSFRHVNSKELGWTLTQPTKEK